MSNLTKKLFVISLTVTTIVWAMGGFLVAKPAFALTTGTLIKTATSSAVYYVGSLNTTTGKYNKYVFPDEKVYFSWYSNFNSVQTVSQETLQNDSDTVGNVVARAGTKLVQFVAIGANGALVVDDPKVYALSPNGTKHWITTATIASSLYGANWETKIYAVPNFLVSNYTAGSDLTTATYPEGALVKLADSATVYYINSTGQKQPLTSTGFTANMFQDQYIVVASSLTSNPDGTSITALDSTLTNVAGGAAAAVGTGLTVAKASDTPASASIISYGASAATGGQGFIPALKLNFTAASDGAVKVKELKLKRVGINATTDLDAVYLYDMDMNFIAQHTSINSDYITFSNSAGLFTVAAGTTESVMVRFNLNKNSTSGKTIGLKVLALADVTTDGATVNGTFPMEGNLMTVANVTDFARLQADTISYPSTVNPSTNVQDLWTFSFQGSNQEITVEKIVLTQVGSIEADDITDLVLYADGNQIGTTQANLGSSNKVTFSDLNYVIGNGVTKNFTLRGKVVGGSSRTFQFSQQNVYDILAKDSNYNAYVVADDTNVGTWTVNQAGAATTINSGSLSINLATTSPTGYMAGGLSSDTIIANYDFTAVGEDVKVSTLNGTVTTASQSLGMDQVKLFFMGSQVGITQDATGTTAWTNLGSSLIVPGDGVAHSFVVKGRTKSSDGGAYTSGMTFYFTLAGTATGAQGVTSLTTVDLSGVSIASNTITISASAPTIAINSNINNYTPDYPTGVKNMPDVLVASWTIIGGTAEPIDVTSIRVDDVSATTELGDYFYNLELYKNSFATSTKIGNTVANLNSGTVAADTYTFTPASAIRVGVNETITLNLYADIKTISTALSTPTALAELGQVIYNKVNTGGSTTWTSTTTDGQADVILLSGTLTVGVPDTQVAANIITMSPASAYNTVELAKFKFTANFEGMNIEKIVFNNTIGKTQVVSTTQATSSLINYTLWNGTTQIGGYGVDAATATPVEGKYITFNVVPIYVLPVGVSTLTLKAQVNTLAQASAGSTDAITLRTTWSGQAAEYGVETVRGASSQTAITSVPAATVTGLTMIVNRQMPIVTPETWSDKTLTNGASETLFKWKVTPSGDTSAGGIKLKKMTVYTTITDTVTSSGSGVLTFDDFILYKDGTEMTYESGGSGDYFIYDGTGTAAADRLDKGGTATMYAGYANSVGPVALFSATGTAVIVFLTEDSVGTSGNVYELKARALNVSTLTTDGDSITVQLVGADNGAIFGNQTPPTSGAYYLDYYPALTYFGGNGTVAGWGINLNTADASAGTEKAAEFIWSDYSKGTAHDSITMPTSGGEYTDTSSSQDWFDGYKVKTSSTSNTYLPLDSVVLTK